jgi:hypothetical protein
MGLSVNIATPYCPGKNLSPREMGKLRGGLMHQGNATER